jgi:GMP synthase (glutamine-hydrolysing)
MARVLIIQNDPPETLGLYEKYLKTYSDLTLIHAYKMNSEDSFPPVDEFTHFIIGPTPISANDAEKHAFLNKELGYLREIIDSGKPCLGVCCGGQILARLLGGMVLKSPSKEIGSYTLSLTQGGVKDQLFHGFPDKFPVFHWHSEMFTIPHGGKLLATGEPCNIQAFNKDNVWGVIFHLEITLEDAERWANAYPNEPADIGKTREQALAECRENEEQMKHLAELLMENFLSL